MFCAWTVNGPGRIITAPAWGLDDTRAGEGVGLCSIIGRLYLTWAAFGGGGVTGDDPARRSGVLPRVVVAALAIPFFNHPESPCK